MLHLWEEAIVLFVDYYRFSDTYTCWPNSGEPYCEGGLLRSTMHAKGVIIRFSNMRANRGKGDVVVKAVSALPHETTESSRTS